MKQNNVHNFKELLIVCKRTVDTVLILTYALAYGRMQSITSATKFQ
jgi:hypothetical protein